MRQRQRDRVRKTEKQIQYVHREPEVEMEREGYRIKEGGCAYRGTSCWRGRASGKPVEAGGGRTAGTWTPPWPGSAGICPPARRGGGRRPAPGVGPRRPRPSAGHSGRTAPPLEREETDRHLTASDDITVHPKHSDDITVHPKYSNNITDAH